MIAQFGCTTTDPHLHECLEGLPGILTTYQLIFTDQYGEPWFLIGATGVAESNQVWQQNCNWAIGQAQRMTDGVSWMVDDLEIEGI